MTERVATALRQQRHVLTRRYMHLSPASLDATIRLLERRGNNEALAGEPRPVWGKALENPEP